MSRSVSMVLAGALVLIPLAAAAQSQPPIQSARDAMCRDEAANRVFTDPNPQGLDPYAIGRKAWQDCMYRAEGARAKRPVKRKKSARGPQYQRSR